MIAGEHCPHCMKGTLEYCGSDEPWADEHLICPACDSTYNLDFTTRAAGASIQHKLDSVIANRIKELKLGLNGERQHSWRALSQKVSGYECQITGSDLCNIAQWTLGEEWNEND